MKTLIACPRCKGTGKTELTGVYADTLDLLRRQSAEINGADLAKLADVPATAMNNRLVRLEELGLATGKPCGRQRLWRPSP